MNRTITDRLRNAMTVAELRDALQDFDDDALVVFTTSYGDYHRTKQALPVERADEMPSVYVLAESAYSHSDVSIEPCDFDSDEEPNEEGPSVVVLCMTRECLEY